PIVLEPAAFEPQELMLLELLTLECLDANRNIGRPQRLLPEEKEWLILLVRESWATRRISLVEMQRQAGLGHAGHSTILRALAEAGIKTYVEEFKFILDEDNMLVHYICLQWTKLYS